MAKINAIALTRIGFFDGGKVPPRNYLINFGLVLTLIFQITAAVVYQSLSTMFGSSQSFCIDLTRSLCFSTYFCYYSIFLTLKIITSPSLFPVHWLTISGTHYYTHCR